MNKKPKNIENPFFAPAGNDPRKLPSLKPENWNKVFPYSFALYEARPDGSVTAPKLAQLATFSSPRVSLNLAPTAIAINLPFASSVVATSGGIIEENNGTVFRQIQISGTTGFFPQRPGAVDPLSQDRAVRAANSFAPASVSAIGQVAAAFQQTVRSAVGTAPKNNPYGNTAFDPDPANLNSLITQSGYYQFWYLHNFMVAYAEMKKSGKFGSIRLAFECPKDNVAYICTPVSFELSRDTGNVYLYRYKIVLTAWQLVNLNGTIAPLDEIAGLPSPNNPGAIRAAVDVVRNARNTILNAKNVLFAASADVNDALSVIGQTFLSAKDLISLPADISDFADSVKANANALLRTDFADRLSQVWNDQSQAGNPKARVALGSSLQGNTQNVAAATLATQTAQGGETVNALSSASSAPAINQGLTTALELALADPSVAQEISLDDFTPPSSFDQSVAALQAKAAKTTASDIRDSAARLQRLSDTIAAATGTMGTEYAETFNPGSLAAPVRSLTEDDVILQANLQNGKIAYSSLLATGELYQELDPDPFVIANEAMPPESQMPSALSTYAVPVQPNTTIDRMAQQFLGDANRAQEIITLNGLLAPYIDEDGFNVSISSVTGRTAIASSAANLYIGQPVTLRGTSKPAIRRKIVNIEEFGPTSFRITFDGDANLNTIYGPSSNPFFNARLPGCVGAGDFLLIPSQETPVQPPGRPTFLQDQLTYAEKVFGIDIAIGPDNDVNFDHNGDIVLAVGYQNAVQALRLKCEVEQRELEQHPSFGLPISVGDRMSDLQGPDVRNQVKSAILNDPRFFNADVSADLEGNAVRIGVTAQGSAGTSLIPVEFRIGDGT